MKSLRRLRSQEATHKGQIDKLELDLQRHRDMLPGVLWRIRVESEECEELRSQVAREQAPSDNGEAIPPTQCDSQRGNGQTASEEMYLSTLEEESGDESMLVGTSGAEDDLDVSQGHGIWERRRSAIVRNERMVKIKDKDRGKVKPCKTMIIEEDPPLAPPGFSETTCGCDCTAISARNWSRHWSFAVLHCGKLGSVCWGSTDCGARLLGHNLQSSVGNVSSRVFFFCKKNL